MHPLKTKKKKTPKNRYICEKGKFECVCSKNTRANSGESLNKSLPERKYCMLLLWHYFIAKLVLKICNKIMSE